MAKPFTAADIFTGSVVQPEPEDKTAAKYLAQRNWRGIGDALLGLPDLINTGINYGIADVASLFGNTDPYQLPMASQSAANLAAEVTGSDIIPASAVSPEVQQKGANQQAALGMIPTGVEDLGTALKAAVFHSVPNLFKAPALQDAMRGIDADEIWRNWQWEKNPVGQWWTETTGKPKIDAATAPAPPPVDQAQLPLFSEAEAPKVDLGHPKLGLTGFHEIPPAMTTTDKLPTTVADVFKNPQLYEQPGLEFLGGLPLNYSGRKLAGGTAAGEYNWPSAANPKGSVSVSTAFRNPVGTAQHELTHAAAQEFGLPQGYSPKSPGAASKGFDVRQTIAGDMSAYEDAFNKRTADYWKHQDEMFEKYGDYGSDDFDKVTGKVNKRPGEMGLSEFNADWAKKNPMLQEILNQKQDELGDLTGMTDEMLAYHTSMGEVSARNAAARDTGWYKPEALRNRRPEKTEDVPRKYQWTSQDLKGEPAASIADDMAKATQPPPQPPPLAKPAVKTSRAYVPPEPKPADIVPHGVQPLNKPRSYEELEGKVMIGAPGDRSDTGKLIRGIGETKFDTPTPLRGGHEFMGGEEQQNADKLIWKSGKHVIDEYGKAVQKAHKASGGKDVVLSNILMGEDAINFSDNATRPIIESMKTAPMTDANKALLDDAINARIRRDAPASPPWPGFAAVHKDPVLLEDWLQRAGSGRTQIAKELELVRWQQLGAIDMGSIRNAVNAPGIRGADKYGTGGHSIGLADPEGRVVTDPIIKRADYSTGLGGTHWGNLPEGIPHDVMFHDYVKAMRERKPGSTAQHEIYALERAKPFQIIDAQQVERVMNYLRSREGLKLGIGGAVGAGLLTQAQADDFLGGEWREDKGGT